MDYPWQNPAAWHAINVHMPVALAMLGIPLAIFVAVTRGGKPWLRWGTAVLYAALIMSALMAVQSGERAMDHLPAGASPEAWKQVDYHEYLARKVWIFATATLVLLLITAIPRKRFRQIGSVLATVAAVLTGIWVMIVGHAGGTLVYQYGMGVPPTSMAGAQVADAASESPTTNVAATQPGIIVKVELPSVIVSYTKQIKPIVDAKCMECHAADEAKGKFVMTTVALMSKAGRKAGPGIVPHKPDDSSIIQYITGKKQPQMPKGDDPLSKAEVQLFRDWIAAGAPDDSTGTPAIIATDIAPSVAPTPAAQASTAPAATQAAPVESASATTAPATAPVVEPKAIAEVISPNWEPNVKWNPAELVAIRRYLRLQFVPPAPAVPAVASPGNNEIDSFIMSQWSTISGDTAGAVPELCDDATFVRRVYLDLIGIIPSAEDARKFVDDKTADKRAKLIDALLNRDADYAANWVPFWEDALCSNGNHQGGVGTHGNYHAWLQKDFEENKPFDLVVTELLDPTMPNNPGRYVLNQDHTRIVQSASDTAQVFMGTGVKCASCHNHFENKEWPQARAAAFAGFFGPQDLELIRCERKTGVFAPTSFLFELPEAPKTVAVDDQNARLHRVAQMIVDPTNPRFSTTIVNRLWKRYFGLGLSEPVDDFREDRAINQSPLLKWLADDFIRNGYNLKHTIRLIMNSRTYQLQFNPALEDHFDVAKQNEPRYYRSPSLRRLTAEQMLDSIAAATNETPKVAERTYSSNESTLLTRALGRPAARNEVSTGRPEDTAVVQALELLNGNEFYDRIYKSPFVNRLSVMSEPAKLAERMYWTVLNRAPSESEAKVATAYLSASPPPPTTQPVELVWVDDDVPAGTTATGAWEWNATGAPGPVSGKRVHSIGGDIVTTNQQHLFMGANFVVTKSDTLFAYIYIDPENAPKQIMLQYHVKGGDWNRAAWGDAVIPFQPQSSLGAIPAAGAWVRLDIPAEKIGLTADATEIDGISFDQAGGRVYWDKVGVTKGAPAQDPATIGDMLWALVTSPEFQYVR